MKNPITYSALAATALSIFGKLIYFLTLSPSEDFDLYTRFFYLLCFVLALFIGLRSWILQNQSSGFPDQVKSGMKIASIFAILISAFTWIYYKLINPEYFAQKISKAVNAGSQSATPEDLEQIKNTAEFIFNAFTHATITLFGIMVIGFFYSVVIVLVFRWKPEIFGLSVKR